MSARRGRVVLFKDVMDEAVRRVLAVESEKSPDCRSRSGANCRQIGLGALAYSMLSVDNQRDIVFEMDDGPVLRWQDRAIHSKRTRARQ